MPIKDMQARMRQLGEIRIGHVVETGKVKDGKPVTRPAKLRKFRLTSPSRPILEKVAELYGGTVQPWTPANGGPQEWEVYTTADRLPILVPPRNAVSQWYELYQGSRCVRRCDGEMEQKQDVACLCNPENRQCKATTRVNVMLAQVPALGQWLLVSKGLTAAMTLPDAAELLAMVGGYVPGWLGMEEKVVYKEDGPPNRFMVPTIDVDIAPAELMAGQVAVVGQAALATAERAAIEAAPSVPAPNYAKLAQMAKTASTVRDVYTVANQAGHMTTDLAATLKARVAALEGQAVPTSSAVVPVNAGRAMPEPEDGIPDVEVVEDAPPSDEQREIWTQIVVAAGPLGWQMQQVILEFASRNGGVAPGSASPADLRRFLNGIKAGEIR